MLEHERDDRNAASDANEVSGGGDAANDATAASECDTANAENATSGGDAAQQRPERSPFPHPEWTVGLVLVAGGLTLLFGLLVHPIWLVVGSPFLIALFLWLFIKVFARSPAE